LQILIGIIIGVVAGVIAGALVVHYTGIYRAPRPKVVLGERTNVTVTESEEASPEDIDRELEEIENKVPIYTASSGLESAGMTPIGAMLKQAALQVPTREEIDRYHRDREKYLEVWKETLKLRARIKHAKASLILVLDIQIRNRRNNVEGLIVDIHLPGNVGVLTAEQYDVELEEPEEPAPPRTVQHALLRGLGVPTIDPSSFMNVPMPDLHQNVSSFRIKKSDSQDIQFDVDFIEHHQMETCGLLCVLFPSFEDIPKKYTFEWKLRATNIPKKQRKGRITVKPVKVKSGVGTR
jgi:hypothetical protein